MTRALKEISDFRVVDVTRLNCQPYLLMVEPPSAVYSCKYILMSCPVISKNYSYIAAAADVLQSTMKTEESIAWSIVKDRILSSDSRDYQESKLIEDASHCLLKRSRVFSIWSGSKLH